MKISDFKDKHLDKLAFVVGAGPSLRHVETDSLKEYVVFTTNSGILKFPNCNYFVTDDNGVCNWNYWKIANNNSCIKFLYRKKFLKYTELLSDTNTVFYDHLEWASNSPNGLVYHKENLTMTNDPDKPIIGARTSVASAIHIAYIMGCNPIVLLGVDGCYEGKNRYYWQFTGEPKAVEYNNNVFSAPNKGFLRGSPIDHHCSDYDLYWKHFSEKNRSVHDIIINSSGGIVEEFPKITIDQVLLIYGDRKK